MWEGDIPIQIIQQDGESVSLVFSGAVAAALIYGRQAAEVVAKVIPDSATGALGTLRRICAVISGYTVNNTK